MTQLYDNFKEFLDAGNARKHTFFGYDELDANPKGKDIVVLYHDKCWDGITAAWCAWLKFKSTAVYIPVNYDQPLPNVRWERVKQVYIVDFSYPADVLDELYAMVNGALVVLDHHKTAEAQLQGAPYAVFNKSLSGAGLAWLYFQERYTFLALRKAKHGVYGSRMTISTMPKYVYHVQDYDLWAFRDKETKAFRAALDLCPQKIETIEKIHSARVNGTSPMNITNLVKRGKIALEPRDLMIREAANTAFRMAIPGFENKIGYGVLVNNPSIVSELGNILAERSYKEGYDGYAAIFQVNKNSLNSAKVYVSLRSTKDVDVSEMAKTFGGGGHEQASGCYWDYSFFLQFMGYLGVKTKAETQTKA